MQVTDGNIIRKILYSISLKQLVTASLRKLDKTISLVGVLLQHTNVFKVTANTCTVLLRAAEIPVTMGSSPSEHPSETG